MARPARLEFDDALYHVTPRDNLGRFTSMTYADGSTINADQYDLGNRLLQFTDSANGTIHRSYDGLDRLTGESSPQGVVAYTYYASGLRKSMTAANQAVVSYVYDTASRLTGLSQGSENVAFGYDAANRRIKLTLPDGIAATYAYDNANEVTKISYATASKAALGALTYGYDSAGRRTTLANTVVSGDQLPAATTADGSFDLNNRQTAFNGATLTYDADGNLTGDGTHTYVWNARNQLAQVKQGAITVASYSYDANGRRTAKTMGGTTTSFLYDGLNAVQETQGSTVNPILTGLGIDERFARNEGATRSYFLTDALGSTVALADAGGSVIQKYQYDPYGNVTASASTTNPYQYTGRENDGLGLYYYRARYYSPGMGRFVSEDPLGFAGGQNNFYAYVDGNPVSYRDSSGKLLVEAGVGAIVGGAWGLASGYFSGDTGDKLVHDALVGAAVGGLAGLTDGVSLFEGGLGYAASGVVGAAGEAARQKWNYGCVKNAGDVFLAGSFGALGQLGGDAARAIQADSSGALGYAARVVDALTSNSLGGATATTVGQLEYENEQLSNNSVDQQYDAFERSLPH